ncbi:hypothetical protein LIER_43126 [Lithospermum erythrorhizon]|uniref:Uncharacterized protein n=1 Tax=Lithospermum erythrorhizon TaxID=34254 RepID=A0AAV3PIU5_LITER
MSLPWIVRNKMLGHVIHEDLDFMHTEMYDECFSVKLHVGGSFQLRPMLDYVGGTTLDFDWIIPGDLDLRTVDEFALRVGQPLGSEVVYMYSVHGYGLTWLKPLMCDSDVDAFRKFSLEGRRYYKANTKNNVDEDDVIQYDAEGADIPNAEERTKYFDDLAFFKEGDTFDDDLDNEIRLENIKIERRKAKKLEIIAKRNMKRMRSEGWEEMTGSSSQPKKKFIGPYARHGLGFKERKSSRYKESSSDEEKDNHVLS